MAKVDPFLDNGLRGWIHSYARKNYWRVAKWYDLDDLIQDGYMCYSKCRVRYADKLAGLDNPGLADRSQKGLQRWFMSLVKTSFHRHILTLVEKAPALIEVPISQLIPEGAEEPWENLCGIEGEAATLGCLVSNAPTEIVAFLKLIVNDGFEAYQRRPVKGRRHGVLETTNEHWCRRLGLDPQKVDLEGMVNEYFGVAA